MERRLNRRFPVDLEVQVTELATQGFSGKGRLTDISNSGVRLSLSQPLTPRDIVRLELTDTLLFGHVVHSRPDGEGFSVGIEVQRVLIGGSDLSRLLQRLLEQTMPHILSGESNRGGEQDEREANARSSQPEAVVGGGEQESE
jgi:hypothetical protein